MYLNRIIDYGFSDYCECNKFNLVVDSFEIIDVAYNNQ